MRLLLACLMLSVAVPSSGIAVPARVSIPSSFKDWKIAFVRGKDIWTAKADGTSQKLVIKSGGAPSWSGDKLKLAFYHDGNIWTLSPTDQSKRQLTHYGKGHRFNTEDIRISWNTKRDEITFARPDDTTATSTASRNTAILAGSSIFDLSSVTTNKPTMSVRFDISDSGTGFYFANNDNPAWSRSGEALAFTRNGDIWIAQYVPEEYGGRAGWDITRLAALAIYDSPTDRASRSNEVVTQLSWSPDEKYLAYCLNRSGGSGIAELHLLMLEKQETTQLTVEQDVKLIDDSVPESSGTMFQPKYCCFSPDGKWIAFSSADTIYAISLDGKRLVKLISHGYQPVW